MSLCSRTPWGTVVRRGAAAACMLSLVGLGIGEGHALNAPKGPAKRLRSSKKTPVYVVMSHYHFRTGLTKDGKHEDESTVGQQMTTHMKVMAEHLGGLLGREIKVAIASDLGDSHQRPGMFKTLEKNGLMGIHLPGLNYRRSGKEPLAPEKSFTVGKESAETLFRAIREDAGQDANPTVVLMAANLGLGKSNAAQAFVGHTIESAKDFGMQSAVLNITHDPAARDAPTMNNAEKHVQLAGFEHWAGMRGASMGHYVTGINGPTHNIMRKAGVPVVKTPRFDAAAQGKWGGPEFTPHDLTQATRNKFHDYASSDKNPTGTHNPDLRYPMALAGVKGSLRRKAILVSAIKAKLMSTYAKEQGGNPFGGREMQLVITLDGGSDSDPYAQLVRETFKGKPVIMGVGLAKDKAGKDIIPFGEGALSPIFGFADGLFGGSQAEGTGMTVVQAAVHSDSERGLPVLGHPYAVLKQDFRGLMGMKLGGMQELYVPVSAVKGGKAAVYDVFERIVDHQFVGPMGERAKQIHGLTSKKRIQRAVDKHKLVERDGQTLVSVMELSAQQQAAVYERLFQDAKFATEVATLNRNELHEAVSRTATRYKRRLHAQGLTPEPKLTDTDAKVLAELAYDKAQAKKAYTPEALLKWSADTVGRMLNDIENGTLPDPYRTPEQVDAILEHAPLRLQDQQPITSLPN